MKKVYNLEACMEDSSCQEIDTNKLESMVDVPLFGVTPEIVVWQKLSNEIPSVSLNVLIIRHLSNAMTSPMTSL